MGGGSKKLKIPPGGGFKLGGGVKCLIYIWGVGRGVSGQPGNPSGYILA